MGGERIIDDPLSVITLLPLFAGLLLLLSLIHISEPTRPY